MKRVTNWKEWFKAAGIRAIRTVAQTATAMLGVSAVMSDINWIEVGSGALLAGIISLLTSLGGLPECGAESTNESEDEESDV